MMKTSTYTNGMLIAFSFLALLWPAHGNAAQGTLELNDVYAFATSEKQRNGAVFMKIVNPTDAAIKIRDAQSDVSDRVELHTHMMEDGMMMMRKLSHYAVPANDHIMLNPMGHHIILIGLKNQLNIGDVFELTLTLEDKNPLILDVEVIAPGTTIAPSSHGHHHDHSHH